MLLRLFPNAHVPTVLLNVSFAPLPRDLPCPASWEAQLHRLAVDDLEVPRAIYALDKSAWLTEILQEVTFDMVSLTIGVTFSDGRVEEWPLMSRECIEVLEGLVEDLQPPTPPKEKERPVSPPPAPAPPPPPSPKKSEKSTKHKKQRSWVNALASLSSLISLSNAPPPVAAPAPAPPPPPPPPPVEKACPPSPETLVETVTDSLFASRALRNRARSGLVDAYRRFVVSELKTRLPEAGYTVWIADSLLRHTVEYMSFMVDQAGGIPPDPRVYVPMLQDGHSFSSPRTICAPSPFFDEEEGDWRSLTDTISTDTDGSSLHTPVSTPSSTQVFRTDSIRPPSTFDSAYTVEELETYARFARQALDLQQSLARMQAAYRNMANEDRQFQAVLEIRSKRRAWSNRQFKGGARMSELGFATPARSSPLARCAPISSAGLSRASYYLSVQTAEYDTARLFPVTEESDDEDLEAGLFFSATADSDDSGEDVPGAPLERPQIRVRTHSIHRLQALDLDAALAPDPPMLFVPPPPPVLAPAPLPGYGGPTFVAPLPKPAPGRGPLFDHDLGAQEFTLAMDVPYAPRAFDEKTLYEHDDWLPGVVVDCR